MPSIKIGVTEVQPSPSNTALVLIFFPDIQACMAMYLVKSATKLSVRSGFYKIPFSIIANLGRHQMLK